MNVELIYDSDCPNVAAARSVLIKAFTRTGISARWKEWERSSPEIPPHVQGYGSPTILVNGEDLAPLPALPGTRACRLYIATDGVLQSTPPLELVCSALLKAAPTKDPARRNPWQTIVASFPAIGTALLPKLTCPLCWPAYAALLSAFGFQFFDYTPYLLPFTVVFLALAISVLAKHAKRSGRRGALIAGIVGAAIMLFGKFVIDFEWLNTVGIGLLVVAIFMSMRPRTANDVACPACVNIESEAKGQTR